ncbi:UvrB/UvrC motif-containing protein, partial [Alicyclobacillus sendaiensis]
AVAEQAQRLSGRERKELIAKLEEEMKAAAKALEFERAAELRDMIMELMDAS